MRRRRQIEAERGSRAAARHLRPRHLAAAAASGVKADGASARCCDQLRVRPVITAHPTEAKRVTVLEKHRRIYRRLVDLESPRWTPRERQALVDRLRNEIELLWLTGELRLAKPTVPQEVYWGLHFFNETLFEAVPDLMEKVERALAQYYPGEAFQVPPFFQFGSWIGGDRDGNPFVTNDVTRSTLLENRLTGAPALPPAARGAGARAEHHRARDHGVGPVPTGARAGARRDRRGRRDRQPEPGRGVPAVPGDDAAAAGGDDPRHRAGRQPGGSRPATPRPTRCVADLKLIEAELLEAGRPEIAAALVRPVRREVEAFRFSTVRLDVRENTTKLNAALRALHSATTGGCRGARGSGGVARLGRGRAGAAAGAGHARCRALPKDSAETLGMFRAGATAP